MKISNGRSVLLLLTALNIIVVLVSFRHSSGVKTCRAEVHRMATSSSSPNSIGGKYNQEVISNFIINPLKVGLGLLTATAAATSNLPALADEPKAIKKPKVKETDLGIKYIDLKKGEGPYPQEGDYVVINYSAFFLNGTMFDTTEKKGGKALSFRYGRKQIIPGIESVLESMQPGGERTCTIPAEYAYGKKGVCVGDQCLVPPDTPVRYALKLKSVGAGFN